eukprot:CAMPEP_0197439726 /NCGR_PEP_ID=MMETSP1175-20131217/6396_1 /TAXON_ID=1003142 /ORGANISM="Triceratium dubium, Strain CCMP147" /LENGTH=185 /DNA_ID=CAMNT_0042969687 /DNA_START=86 /DNA_END=643 /DNA_ORIENTATION=-
MAMSSMFPVAVYLAAIAFSSRASTASAATGTICPGSPASVHAKCEMTVRFPNESDCSEVLEEITLRLEHKNGWVDPHNGGKYELLSSSKDKDTVLLEASRRTGNGQYTDLLNVQLTAQNGCVVEACSESQVTSILDFSTNYCNLHNLYDGNLDNAIKHKFVDYQEVYESCRQRNVNSCNPNEGDA